MNPKVIFELVADDNKLMKDLDDARSNIESKSGGFGSAAKKIGAAIGGALATKQIWEWGTAFEQTMANASTLFGDAEPSMEALNQRILDISDSSGVAAYELGEAFTTALSSGIPATDDMSEALGFLEQSTKLAKSGFTDLDTVVDATTSILNAYKMDVSETAKVQEILQKTQDLGKTTVGELGASLAQVTPTAAAMNVSFEQIGASLSVMTAQGIPTAQATTKLNALFNELGKSGTKGSDALKAATEGTKYAGKSFNQLMQEGVPLSEILTLIGEHAAENGLQMADMFGSIEAGSGALTLSGENAAAYTDALAAMAEQTGAVDAAYEKVMSTSGEQFNKTMNELKNIAIDLFLQFAPFIVELLPMLGEMLQMILPPLMEIVQSLLPPFLEIISALLPPLGEIINSLMPIVIELFNAFVPVVQAVFEVLKWLIDFIVGVFTGEWSEAWQAIGQLFTDLWNTLTTFIKDTWNGIKQTAENVFNSLKRFFEGVWNAISGVFSNTVGKIKGFMNDLKSGVEQVISGIRRIFQGLSDFISGVFTGNWSKAWNGIKNIFGGAFDSMVGLMKAPVNWIISGLNTFISGLNKIKIPDWVPGVGGKGINLPRIPSLKVGMEYIPTDEFPALLHAGEAVLTQEQASRWRAGLPRFENFHQYAFAGSQNVTVHNQMVGTVEMDGYTVGKVVLRNLDDVRGMDS